MVSYPVWLCMDVLFLPWRSECIDCSLAPGRHSLCTGQKPLSVQCCWVLHRTRIRRMRCSVVSIAWSQRAMKPHNSRCAVRNTPFSTCSANPMSSRSSMVSSNWYCNLIAKILTRWTKRSCWIKARTWSAVALRAALSMEKVQIVAQRLGTSFCGQVSGQETQRRVSSSPNSRTQVKNYTNNVHLEHLLMQPNNSMLVGPNSYSTVPSVLHTGGT